VTQLTTVPIESMWSEPIIGVNWGICVVTIWVSTGDFGILESIKDRATHETCPPIAPLARKDISPAFQEPCPMKGKKSEKTASQTS